MTLKEAVYSIVVADTLEALLKACTFIHRARGEIRIPNNVIFVDGD